MQHVLVPPGSHNQSQVTSAITGPITIYITLTVSDHSVHAIILNQLTGALLYLYEVICIIVSMQLSL